MITTPEKLYYCMKLKKEKLAALMMDGLLENG
jgi:hypothetical protein